MRWPTLTVCALAFLRVVVGMHFFLEGLAHLRDPNWSSAGFRKAAVGPLADRYRAALPQTGDWAGTVGKLDARSPAEAAAAWTESVVSEWRTLLERRLQASPRDDAGRRSAEERLEAARGQLADYVAGLSDDVTDYRLQVARLAGMERRPGAVEIPFERDRVAKKRRELAALADGWMAGAAAIGDKLVAEWDAQLASPAARRQAAAAARPSALWRGDRFVSWSLLTIGGCLVLGLFVKFNAVGAACFLASVIASQPFWVPGAQPTYDQWVELAALLVIAALPIGGWSGLDYFRHRHCPLTAWCRGSCTGARGTEG